MTIEGHLLPECSLLASGLSQILGSPEMAAFHQVREHCFDWHVTPQTGYVSIELGAFELNLSLEMQNEDKEKGLNFLA